MPGRQTHPQPRMRMVLTAYGALSPVNAARSTEHEDSTIDSGSADRCLRPTEPDIQQVRDQPL